MVSFYPSGTHYFGASVVDAQEMQTHGEAWANAMNNLHEIEATRARPCECHHCGARRWVAGRCYYCETEREGVPSVAPGRPVHG